MNEELARLVEAARTHQMTRSEREAQARSWVFGNGNIENPNVTPEVVEEAQRRLRRVAESA